jgi:hypothetical protein
MRSKSLDLAACAAFRPWTDPGSGITSYLLDERVAPLQQSFYFTNRSLTDDGAYLWFYCAHPPGGNAYEGRTLGVLDVEREQVRWFPETQFRDASPMVGPDGVYWCWEYTVYRRGPAAHDEAVVVNAIPQRIHRQRAGERLATHLTLSGDGRELFLDASFGREWVCGSLPVDGGDFEIWQIFDRCYNHAQFHPHDPDLVLLAQDYWDDVATGEHTGFDNRMWLLRRGEKATPIYPEPRRVGHEWWAADGEHVWYVDYVAGTEKVHIHTGERTNVWPAGNLHSHADAGSRYLVGDIVLREKSSFAVAFYNIATGRRVDIVTQMPQIEPRYHVHPHPQFCVGDTWIAYTSSVHGRADVAVVPVAALIEATS